MKKPKQIVVLGAGVGGLVASVDLARQGADVLLLERQAQVGGKMRQVNVGSQRLDAGPTVLTMRWVFDELCDDAGVSLEDVARVTPTDCLGRHVWADGSRLDLHADIDRSADAIATLSGQEAAEGYRAFCRYAAEIHACVDAPIIRTERPSLWGLFRSAGWKGLPRLRNIDSGRSMWRALGDFFDDPRLRQLFGRYATYCGGSPFAAPATLNLVAHVERLGVHLVEGGMYRLAEGLAGLATRFGAQIRCSAPVKRIVTTHGRVSGVELEDGERIEAAAVVANADASTVAMRLLARGGRHFATKPSRRSLSALTWSLVAPTSGRSLLRHNVFFQREDYAAEFRDIFTRGKLPTTPTVYVCAQDRDEDGKLADGARQGERLLVLVNAPPTADSANALTSEEIQRCEDTTFSLLARCGLSVERTHKEAVLSTPADFERLCPGTGGAIYGPVGHGWRSTFKRAWVRSGPPGLYLASGSVHPGPGVPMAALGGRMAAKVVLRDLAST